MKPHGNNDLGALVAGMIADVKQGKFKKRVLTEKVALAAPAPHNPWTEEALVLIMYNTRCTACGNEATSWESNLYIERSNTRRRSPITSTERLEACVYSSVYGGLPKRIEVIQRTSCTCPQCFGIKDSNHNVFMGEVNPHQLPLFKETQNVTSE